MVAFDLLHDLPSVEDEPGASKDGSHAQDQRGNQDGRD